jgi:2-C-methyl-D-erythritol 4-phosphate cytidylyltransferase
VLSLKKVASKSWALVVVAAGSSQRLKSSVPKPYLTLHKGRTVLEISLEAFRRVPGLRYSVVVTRKDYLDQAFSILKRMGMAGRSVEGGAEREDSVALGLEAVPPGIPLVLIHDAARPFVSSEIIEGVFQGAAKWGAVVPGVPVTDTIKLTRPDGKVVSTLPRQLLSAVQTPQGFKTEVLRKAFKKLGRRRSKMTDDGAVAQEAGFTVHVVPGEPGNFKITTPHDLHRARNLAKTIKKEKRMNRQDAKFAKKAKQFSIGI